MGVLGAQPHFWTLPSTILFILANGDGRAVPTWVRLHGACSPQIRDRTLRLTLRGCGNALLDGEVLRLVWIDKSRGVDRRTERDPGDHRQNGEHLAGLPVPICVMLRIGSYHLVDSRRVQGPTGC